MAGLKPELVPMDGGTAQRINGLINDQVACRKNSYMPFSNNDVAAQVFGGLLQSYGIICRLFIRTAEPDDPKYFQCVVMSGDVMRCPVYGTTPGGESRGEHERIDKIKALQ